MRPHRLWGTINNRNNVSKNFLVRTGHNTKRTTKTLNGHRRNIGAIRKTSKGQRTSGQRKATRRRRTKGNNKRTNRDRGGHLFSTNFRVPRGPSRLQGITINKRGNFFVEGILLDGVLTNQFRGKLVVQTTMSSSSFRNYVYYYRAYKL